MTKEEKLRELLDKYHLTSNVTEDYKRILINMILEILYEPSDRKFVKVVVDYPKSFSPCFKDGQPYYQIMYRENGKEIVGYGTYNLDVFSQYLQEFIQPMPLECEDCVSRQEAIEVLEDYSYDMEHNTKEKSFAYARERMCKLSSVQNGVLDKVIADIEDSRDHHMFGWGYDDVLRILYNYRYGVNEDERL